MNILSSKLYNICFTILTQCDEFASHNSLRAVFARADLQPFQDRLPEVDNVQDRVSQTLYYLEQRYLSSGQSALLIFATALRERRHPDDALYIELGEVCFEIEQALDKVQAGDVDGHNIGGEQHFHGLNIQELIDALRQAFPPDDPRPEQFREVFNQFVDYHNRLYEWKELHNYFHQILSAYDQFRVEIERLDVVDVPGDLSAPARRWRVVSLQIGVLLEWASVVKYIGVPYRGYNEPGGLTGEKWAVELSVLQVEIGSHLHNALNELPNGSLLFQLLRGRGRPRSERYQQWKVLYDLTTDLGDAIYRHMYIADKALRDTVNQLYQFSKAILD